MAIARLVAALATAIAVLTCAPTMPVTANPRDLVLQLEDLPEGFAEDESNLRPSPPATPIGYARTYRRVTFFGPAHISAIADVFSSAPAASAQMGYYVSFYEGLGYRRVADTAVGDESVTFHAVTNLDASEFVLVFRFRNVINIVAVVGARGQVDQETALQLARKQFARQNK